MPVGSLKAQNSWLSFLVKALRCAFLGAGLILEERTKGGSACVHYSVAIRTLSIEEKKQGTVRICPAVLYESLALLTGHCICPAVLHEILALLKGAVWDIQCSVYLDYSIATI